MPRQMPLQNPGGHMPEVERIRAPSSQHLPDVVAEVEHGDASSSMARTYPPSTSSRHPDPGWDSLSRFVQPLGDGPARSAGSAIERVGAGLVGDAVRDDPAPQEFGRMSAAVAGNRSSASRCAFEPEHRKPRRRARWPAHRHSAGLEAEIDAGLAAFDVDRTRTGQRRRQRLRAHAAEARGRIRAFQAATAVMLAAHLHGELRRLPCVPASRRQIQLPAVIWYIIRPFIERVLKLLPGGPSAAGLELAIRHAARRYGWERRPACRTAPAGFRRRQRLQGLGILS